MSKPRLLDLFCGAGGASVGYARAGWDVTGIDIRPQPNYPFRFVQGDALDAYWSGFDAIHASPPCQQFTRAKHLMKAQGGTTAALDLIAPTRDLLEASGLPWVMENVSGSPLESPMVLCGSMFGLRVRRHRLFEASSALLSPGPCQHKAQGKPVGIYGSMGDTAQGRDNASGRWVVGGSTARNVAEAQEAMGIDWMPRWSEIKESIPPAYTEHIGQQLIQSTR